MVRRVAAVALAAAGTLLVVRGVDGWLESRAVREAVAVFLETLRRGDADPGWTYRIQRVENSGAEAVAEVWIEKDGYKIQPRLHLTRSAEEGWRIAGIEGLSIDPRWDAHVRARARAADERTALELERALAGRPGVRVERLAANGEPAGRD